MKKDILTVSRFMRQLNQDEATRGLNIESGFDGVVALSSIKEEMIEPLFSIISDGESLPSNIERIKAISEFIFYISSEYKLYSEEIEARKNHVKSLGLYEDDTPEQISEKIEKNKNIYRFDNSLNAYYILAKCNLNPLSLSLFEALILLEQFLCEETNRSSYELLHFIEDDVPSFYERANECIRHANFYSFALDINNDVVNMYQSIERKKKDKKNK